MVERVLVVSPHPDDETLGCGGTLRIHAEAGAEIRVVFLTSGEHGGHGLDPVTTAALREKEAAAATALLGVSAIEFWRLPDGRLKATASVANRLASVLQAWHPDLVFVPHPADGHADHRAAARVVRAALRHLPVTAGRPRVLMFEIWTPLGRMDEIVDISATIGVKLDAIRKYETQCAALRFDEAFAGLARYRGEMHSWPEGEYAEVFEELRG